MRVYLKYASEPDLCENASYGEVEDYTVRIISGVDLQLLLDHLFTGIPVNNEYAGDVDGNGYINILDVRLLMNHLIDNSGYPLNCTC